MLKEEVAGPGGQLLPDGDGLPAALIWKYLRAADDMRARSAGRGRQSLEGLVLAHGREFHGTALPDGAALGALGECYINAWQLATMVDNLAYVEGYAMSPEVPVPLLHAWCADEAGRAVDPTWPSAARCAYVGIPLARGFVRRRLLATKTYGVLPNLWIGLEQGHLSVEVGR